MPHRRQGPADPHSIREVVVGQGLRLRIFARDPARARAFYAQIFGWSLPDDGWHCWVITPDDDPRLGIDGPHPMGANHAAGPGEAVGSGKLIIPTIHVTDLDATATAATTAGGDVLVPRIPVPGIGWLIYLADTEGNVIGIMQDDPRAAWPPPPSPDTSASTRAPRRSGGGASTRRRRHRGTGRRPRRG
ncbi:VOC family protein [Rugosimonospora africana]|uniref:Glyoxalase-like domain-containing protein n=1 Tax=Rugosimonospora africana TaxID=556532 RepID=A0A8J3R1W4_9ACTN|nr:VOC family protein [Rugosimonospora africana]GIH21465.1 hypothetical protein Raf01_96370 [Rugosimonospora africana]